MNIFEQNYSIQALLVYIDWHLEYNDNDDVFVSKKKNPLKDANFVWKTGFEPFITIY